PPALSRPSLRDALPISAVPSLPDRLEAALRQIRCAGAVEQRRPPRPEDHRLRNGPLAIKAIGDRHHAEVARPGALGHILAQAVRSEEHTSELQSRENLV